MYCSNCGEKINENAVVCVHCGCAVAPKKNNSNKKNMTNNTNDVKGIVSLVLGVVAIILFLYLFKVDVLFSFCFRSLSVNQFNIFIIFILSIITVIGVVLAVLDRKTDKNIINTIGYWINLVILIVNVYQICCGIYYNFYLFH